MFTVNKHVTSLSHQGWSSSLLITSTLLTAAHLNLCCSSSLLPDCCSLNSAHYLYHIVNPVVQCHYLLSSFLAALISCQIVCCTKISAASFTRILHQNLYTSQGLYFYSPMRSSLAGQKMCSPSLEKFSIRSANSAPNMCQDDLQRNVRLVSKKEVPSC